MLNDVKKIIKDKCRPSDGLLKAATKFAKGAEWWCASGVAFWGIGAIAGLGVIGLHAIGIGIPAFLGASTIVFCAVMAAKSVVLQQAFRALYKRGVKELDSRRRAAPPRPAPVPAHVTASPLARTAPARRAFNANVEKILSLLPHPGARHPKIKTVTPANSRLHL